MKLEVTQEDIDKGKQGNTMSCPIALALVRKFGGYLTPEVTECSIRGYMYDTGSLVFSTATPPAAALFIEDFDDCGRAGVTPIDLDLDIDEPKQEGQT